MLVSLLVGALLCQGGSEFGSNFNGNIETAIVANEARKSGGGEFSMGDYIVNFKIDAAYTKGKNRIGLYFDFVPESSVWNYADTSKINYNNEYWMRQDGYTNRPYILTGLYARHLYDGGSFLEGKIGGFLASGLTPLDGIPNQNSLTMPIPLVFSQHYDKGIMISYSFKKIFQIDAGLIDGDYTTGEADVYTLHDSAHNSYPSLAGALQFTPTKILPTWWENTFGQLTFGGTGTKGDQGSYPGEKRRQNNLTAYVDYQVPCLIGYIEVRPFATWIERNPIGDGSGKHVPPVRTRGKGIELAYRDISTPFATIDLYGHIWEMENLDNVADGEIWFASDGIVSQKLKGWTTGIKFNDPFGITDNKVSYFGFSYSNIKVDNSGSFAKLLGQESFAIYLFSFGLNW